MSKALGVILGACAVIVMGALAVGLAAKSLRWAWAMVTG